MIRIGKMTDYGIVLLSHFVRDPERTVLTARDLSAVSHLPLPTVSKLLKSLSRRELLVSQRGVKGGYRLARLPEQISVSEIIGALEGPIGMTECSGELTHSGNCELESFCPVKSHWRKISDTIRFALGHLTLLDMTQPLPAYDSARRTPVLAPSLAQRNFP